MPVGERNDPFLGYNFAVEIDGLVSGGFSEVSGLQIEVEVEEYREGGLNTHMQRRAGPVKFPANLVLRHGITSKAELWDWLEKTMRGEIERRNVSVILLDSAGEEQIRWNVSAAYPVRWSGPDLRASGNEIAVESVEFAHSGFAKA